MSEPFFKAEDFRFPEQANIDALAPDLAERIRQKIANRANAKLETLGTDPVTKFFRDECERLRAELAALKAEIEAAPVMYSEEHDDEPGVRVWRFNINPCDTHRARLIRIEGLK